MTERTHRRTSRRTGTVLAGAALLAGGVAVAGPAVADGTAGDQVDAFFHGGCTNDDAAALAKQWSSPDSVAAKVTAGEKLAAGETLPVAPSSTPAS